MGALAIQREDIGRKNFPGQREIATPAAGATLEKGLELLSAIVMDGGVTRFAHLVEGLALPSSTAYRLLAVLERQRLVTRVACGRYVGGARLTELSGANGLARTFASVSRPILRQLAERLKQTVHLGVLDGDMVTYLVKESAHGEEVFSSEGSQLEAYCSAIGKMLLSALSAKVRDAYLLNGPFVSLTPRTIVNPDQLRCELAQVRARGYAIDDGEIADDLRCVAYPLRDADGRVVAALSISGATTRNPLFPVKYCVAALQACAVQIEQLIWRPLSR